MLTTSILRSRLFKDQGNFSNGHGFGKIGKFYIRNDV